MSEINKAPKKRAPSKRSSSASVETSGNDVIGSPSKQTGPAPTPSMESSSGTIGSASAKTNLPSEKASLDLENKVAIFSTSNVSWPGVGKVGKGYNILPQAAADKWLTRNHTRLATPEEVKRELS
jgi:hypothetical protein